MTTGMGSAMSAVFGRAQRRAAHSDAPGKFMNEFEDDLAALNAFGAEAEQQLIAEARGTKEPVALAAEIEALSAFRALQHWGTEWGLCPGRWSDGKRYRQDARGRLAGSPAGKQGRRR